MPQFDVCKNRDSATRSRFPLLLDVQSDLLGILTTRVVVPLSPAPADDGGVIKQLTPVLTIDSKRYRMVTPQLAGISTRELGQVITNVAHQRPAIIAALDLLFTGI
ncbi:MAG TPA: CcdB family protein [Steroidobacteraceae bacterium]|nr:CcdB family protein [Steroidobacteraceae bacterium]